MRIFGFIVLLAVSAFATPQVTGDRRDVVTAGGSVVVTRRAAGDAARDGVVIWLTPLGETTAVPRAPAGRFRIVQQDKRFTPHLLVVPVGAVVDFPNLDPFFHNAFSLFNGRRFDLGLYESGASRSATFTKAGVSFIFCNIHPDMTAVVVSLDTPYYAVTTRTGEFGMKDVPAGRYTLSVWHERYSPERPGDYPRAVTLSRTAPPLGVIRLVDTDDVAAPHKDKYGKDYPPVAAGPLYRGGGPPHH